MGVDDNDTRIDGLPDSFRERDSNGCEWHRSIRLRFRADDSVEKDLEQAIRRDPTFWHSDFLDYPICDDLGGPRFSPDQSIMATRERRARLVARAIQANCELVLDSLEHTGSDYRLERNPDALNQYFETTGQSALHMFANVWVRHDGRPRPLGIVESSTFHRV